MSWWYLSFVDDASKDFLGGAVVEAVDMTGARTRASSLVKHLPMPIQVVAFPLKNIPDNKLPSLPNRNRLLTFEELTRELGEFVNFEVWDGRLNEIKEN